MREFARRNVKALVGLAAAALMLSLALLAPAGAHTTTPDHLWKKHIRPKADARYLQHANVYVSASDTLGSGVGTSETKTIDCPAGTQAVGGGVDFNQASANVDVVANGPLVAGDNMVAASTGKNGKATGWKVSLVNEEAAVSYTYRIGAICSK